MPGLWTAELHSPQEPREMVAGGLLSGEERRGCRERREEAEENH